MEAFSPRRNSPLPATSFQKVADVGLSPEDETSQTLSIYTVVGGAFWSNGNQLNYGGGLKLHW